jgi:8-oxo-dGTP pyrophosphatase MutT (NUDIX family)
MKAQNGPWKVTGSEVKYTNPWVSVREDQVVRLDGTPGIFGVVDIQDGCSVLALDKAGNVYLEREYRYALENTSMEVVSGGMDNDESPLEAARRELKEEAGLTAQKWTDLGFINLHTTIVQCRNYLFLAEDIEEGARSLDPNEKIEIVKMPLSQAYEMVTQGQITHAASVALILKTKIAIRQA